MIDNIKSSESYPDNFQIYFSDEKKKQYMKNMIFMFLQFYGILQVVNKEEKNAIKK